VEVGSSSFDKLLDQFFDGDHAETSSDWALASRNPIPEAQYTGGETLDLGIAQEE
jgi:hypothetical protein